MLHSLVGHDDIVRSFQNRLKEGTLSHAYLFFGPARIGKTTLLQVLTKMIVCEGEDEDSCRSCVALQKSLHPDVFFLDGEESPHIPIETVREIEHHAGLLPSIAKAKVIALAHCDRLTNEAANALLKMFEDPPPHTIFLATTNVPGRIPSTVRSRMERIRCRRVPEALIQKTWGKELSHFAEGCPGDAVRATKDSEMIEQWEKERDAWTAFFREPVKYLHAFTEEYTDRDHLEPFLLSGQHVLHDLLRSEIQQGKKTQGRTRTFLRALLRARRLLEQTNASPRLLFEEFLFTCIS